MEKERYMVFDNEKGVLFHKTFSYLFFRLLPQIVSRQANDSHSEGHDC